MFFANEDENKEILTNPHEEEATSMSKDKNEAAAPVITMKGLSGKKIASVVKVVKVKKKAAGSSAQASEETSSELAKAKESANASANVATEASAAPSQTSSGAAEAVEEPKLAKQKAANDVSVKEQEQVLTKETGAQDEVALATKETKTPAKTAKTTEPKAKQAQAETHVQAQTPDQAQAQVAPTPAKDAVETASALATLDPQTAKNSDKTAKTSAKNKEVKKEAVNTNQATASKTAATPKTEPEVSAKLPGTQAEPTLKTTVAQPTLPTKLGKIDEINREKINRAKQERENAKKTQASRRAIEATKALDDMHRKKHEQTTKIEKPEDLKPTLAAPEIVVPKPIGKIQLPQRRTSTNNSNGQRGENRFAGNRDRNGNAAGNKAKGNRFERPNNNFADKDKDEERKPISHARKTKPQVSAASFGEMLGKETNRRNFSQKDNHKKRNDNEDLRKNGRNLKNERSRGKISAYDDDENERRRGRRKNQSNTTINPMAAQVTHVSLPSQLTVKEFAEAIKKTASEVIMKLMAYGVMVNMNQDIDYDTAATIADEFGITCDPLVEVTEEDILFDDSEDVEENLVERPPVVVVMGHVDHGKTTLLDHIRNANVASGEAGGITQHIGAYTVSLKGRKITFLDTPGHEAFTTMRARGAQATDIAILVVAADDGVMPQTIEAINHAKAAKTEIIVAINKMDKPGANPDRVKQELATHDLIPEEWGGSTIMVPISAKKGENVDQLLEMVLLTADLMELKADPTRQAKGVVLEASLDKNRGVVASLLVQRGTLKCGDTLVTGSIVGNIRAMVDSRSKAIKQAGPSVPVQIIGLPEIPEAGEIFYQVKDEKMARQLAEKRRESAREEQIRKNPKISLDALFNRLEEGKLQDLNIIVKGDVVGSVEAMNQSLQKLSNNEVRINIIHSAAGAITESDVRLADVSNAIIIGFNVRPNNNVVELADELGVDIRLYRVIYNAIEDIEKAMKGLLAPTYEEKVLGHVEVRETFKISSIGTIAGGYVTDGKAVRNAEVRLLRDSKIIYEGKLASLKRFKDDAKEVNAGYECGLSLENYNDIKVGDVFELYEMAEVETE